jgi:hypothetical protein
MYFYIGVRKCVSTFARPPAEHSNHERMNALAWRGEETEKVTPSARSTPLLGIPDLSPHGGDGLGCFLAISSVPESPESVSQRTWFALRKSRPAEAPNRGALREETPSCEGPRYLSPWQASESYSEVGYPFTLPRRLSTQDDSAFGIGRCKRVIEPCFHTIQSLGINEHLWIRYRCLVWTTKQTGSDSSSPCD